MKTKISILFALMVLLYTCKPKDEQSTKAVDLTAVKIEVKAVVDGLHAAIINKDADALYGLLTKNGLYAGTDPSEIWDYEKYVEEVNKLMADTTMKVDYTVDKQIIRIDSTGLGAIILEQFVIKLFSEKMAVRAVSHTVKENGSWKIDFFSWAFIPKNEDIEKINKALE